MSKKTNNQSEQKKVSKFKFNRKALIIISIILGILLTGGVSMQVFASNNYKPSQIVKKVFGGKTKEESQDKKDGDLQVIENEEENEEKEGEELENIINKTTYTSSNFEGVSFEYPEDWSVSEDLESNYGTDDRAGGRILGTENVDIVFEKGDYKLKYNFIVEINPAHGGPMPVAVPMSEVVEQVSPFKKKKFPYSNGDYFKFENITLHKKYSYSQGGSEYLDNELVYSKCSLGYKIKSTSCYSYFHDLENIKVKNAQERYGSPVCYSYNEECSGEKPYLIIFYNVQLDVPSDNESDIIDEANEIFLSSGLFEIEGEEVDFEDLKNFGGGYFSHKDDLYYNGGLVEEGDPATFQVLDEECIPNMGGCYSDYGKDKDNFYYQTEVIDVYDPDSFEVLTMEEREVVDWKYDAQDSEYKYRRGEVIE